MELLDDDFATKVLRQSRIYMTQPIGDSGGEQLPYFNAAALLSTQRDPHSLLDLLMRIERRLCRRRTVHWGSRTVDLDLLLYDEQILETPRLTIPHPRMTWRRFVLMPAAEIARTMIHPYERKTVGELLARITDRPMSAAVAGPAGSAAVAVARRLADRTDGRSIQLSSDKWAGMLSSEAIQFGEIEGSIISCGKDTVQERWQPRLLGWIGPAEQSRAVARFLNCPVVPLLGANDERGFEELAAAAEGVRDIDSDGLPMVEPL